MEKIERLYLNPLGTKGTGDYIGTKNGILTINETWSSRYSNRDDATRLIIEAGYDLYSPGNWDIIQGYDESRQEFWELVGKFPEEIESFCQLSYSLGVNPLPQLRKGLTIPVHYSCSGNPYRIAPNPADKGKPYLVVLHNPDTNECQAFIGHYEYYGSHSDNEDEEDEPSLAIQ
jgi:hypothetical protein